MTEPQPQAGPLVGMRVLEFEGLGPAPFCAMMLADMGAEVLRIARPAGSPRVVEGRFDVTGRGRRSLALDLKEPASIDTCLALIGKADILIEGFRPGVMERLGLGPEPALARNPALVYGRMTGWGQSGPLAQSAGHDINYIAISGALHAIGPRERPTPPLNLVGDYGGGAMFLAVGVLAAALSARSTGRGQVVDAAMSDGAAALMGAIYGLSAAGLWSDAREANLLDGAAPFYGVFECADGQWASIGPLEPQFFAALLKLLGLDEHPGFADRFDQEAWPAQRAALAEVFRTRTRDAWTALLEGTEACYAAVLGMAEAPAHPHNVARGTFVELDGVVQPAPAPRFSATQGRARAAATASADDLRGWGLDEDRVAALVASA